MSIWLTFIHFLWQKNDGPCQKNLHFTCVLMIGGLHTVVIFCCLEMKYRFSLLFIFSSRSLARTQNHKDEN